VLTIVFKHEPPRDVYTAIDLPRSIGDVFHEQCLKAYGPLNIQVAQDKRELKAKEKGIKFVCDVVIPERDAPLPGRCKPASKISKSVLDELVEDEADELQFVQEAQDDSDATNFTPAQKREQLERLHTHVDAALADKKGLLDQLLSGHKTDRYMAQFSQAVEKGVAQFGQLNAASYKALAGRSTVNLKKVVDNPVAIYNDVSQDIEGRLSQEAHRHLTQYRRLMSIKTCVCKIHRIGTRCETGKVSNLRAQIVTDVNAFVANHVEGDDVGELVSHFRSDVDDLKFNVFKIMKFAERVLANFRALKRRQSQNGRARAKVRLSTRKVHGVISKALKANAPAPMTCLKRTVDQGVGKPVGSFTSDPAEVDQILRHAWGKITDGNVTDLEGSAERFWAKYGHLCHVGKEWNVGALTLEDFKAICHCDKESAAGLDGWAAKDIALLSDYALGFIVRMLNAIEEGAPWPEHMLDTRAVFLSKDPDKTDDPLAYRILKITSGWYRKWGSCRNRDLRAWIDTWDCPELNSGVPGKGAQDAWYNTALRVELARLSDHLIAGGSIDVYKCFDQVNREIVYKLASEAGMPKRILDPYFRYIDSLQIRYQVGSTVGEQHYDVCSIPQGCPFSMTIVAIIMLPWVHRMRELEVEPRVLADDLMFLATGEGHRAKTIRAMSASKEFFVDVGARVADNKCFTFAGDAVTRSLLSAHTWDDNDLKIPCCASFRDLGSHLNLGCNHNGSTLTQRIYKAATMAKHLRWLQVGTEMKERIVLSNILPAALYGVETTRVAKTALAHLRSVIADVVGPKSAKRNVNIVFDCVNASKELDPVAHIVYLRLVAIRRAVVKHRGKKGLMGLIIKRYAQYKPKPKVSTHSIWSTCVDDCPDHDDQGSCEHGPVGLLVEDLAGLGCTLTHDFRITTPDEVSIDLLEMPWQHLKTAFMGVVARNRAKATLVQRSFCGSFDEIDLPILKTVVNSLGVKEQHVYKHIVTGGFWADDDLVDIQVGNGKCVHCGEEVDGPSHILWNCAHINKHRKCNKLDHIDASQLPASIANGLPPAMGTDFVEPLWGKIPGHDHVSGLGDYEKCRNADAKNGLINHLANILGLNVVGLCARKAFTMIKGTPGPTVMPVPHKCSCCAPTAINVYTDGSWLNPLKQYLGLGGAGVWWPGRYIDRGHPPSDQTAVFNPISGAELEIAHFRQQSGGLQLFTKIGGFGGSSTRTELAAGVIAICANGPVHIGSDSRAFVDKANLILGAMAKNPQHTPSRPWALTSDGDLWEHFEKAVRAKSVSAVKISWVKGHATQQHVDDGVTTHEQKIGNFHADGAADEATSLHGKDVCDVASWLHDRAKRYTSFMKDVSHHIIEAYLIHRTLVQRIDEQATTIELDTNKGVPFVPLDYPSSMVPTHIEAQASVSNFKALCVNHPKATRIESYFSNLDVVKCGPGSRPITWIELYVLFCIRGYEVIEPPASLADTRPNPDKLLRDFKNTSRAVLGRVLSQEDYASYFKPATRTKDILGGIAITGQLPAVAFNVVVGENERKEIARAIIHLSRKITDKNVTSFIEGKRKLCNRVLALNGNSGWVSTIKTLSPTPADSLWASAPLSDVGPTETTKFYSCRNCDKVEPSTCGHFQYLDLDCKLKCMHCRKQSSVCNWKCACGIRWYVCALHCKGVGTSNVLPQSHVQAHGQALSSRGTKRVAFEPASSYQELLQEDLRRERKRACHNPVTVVTLGDLAGSSSGPTKLGPILSKRFGSPA
jgi:ribonuclease HI